MGSPEPPSDRGPEPSARGRAFARLAAVEGSAAGSGAGAATGAGAGAGSGAGAEAASTGAGAGSGAGAAASGAGAGAASAGGAASGAGAGAAAAGAGAASAGAASAGAAAAGAASAAAAGAGSGAGAAAAGAGAGAGASSAVGDRRLTTRRRVGAEAGLPVLEAGLPAAEAGAGDGAGATRRRRMTRRLTRLSSVPLVPEAPLVRDVPLRDTRGFFFAVLARLSRSRRSLVDMQVLLPSGGGPPACRGRRPIGGPRQGDVAEDVASCRWECRCAAPLDDGGSPAVQNAGEVAGLGRVGRWSATGCGQEI